MLYLVHGHYFYSLVHLLKFFSGPLQEWSRVPYERDSPGIYPLVKVTAIEFYYYYYYYNRWDLTGVWVKATILRTSKLLHVFLLILGLLLFDDLNSFSNLQSTKALFQGFFQKCRKASNLDWYH